MDNIKRTITAALNYILLYLTTEGVVWQYMTKEECDALQDTKIGGLLEKLPFQ